MNINTDQSMPITPKHAEIINQVLQMTVARIQELAPLVGYEAPEAPSLEQVQYSPLAKNLRVIARYAGGEYSAAHSIR